MSWDKMYTPKSKSMKKYLLRLFSLLLLLTAGGTAMAADGKLYWNTMPKFEDGPEPHFTVTTTLRTDSPQRYRINRVEIELYDNPELTTPYMLYFNKTTGKYANLQSTIGFNKVDLEKRNVIKLTGSGIGKWTADIPTEALALSEQYMMGEKIYINTVIYYNGNQKMQDKPDVWKKLQSGKLPAWMSAKPSIVVPRITLEKVEGYWDPLQDQSQRFQEERRKHGVSSQGHGGYFLKISYDKHPQITLPIYIRLDFRRECDVLHPKYPTDGSAISNVKMRELCSLDFKVRKGLRDMEIIDYAFGEEHDNLPTKNVLEFIRNDWKPFEIFVPWELFHLYGVEPQEKELKVNIFLHAEVWRSEDMNPISGKGFLGENSHIPIHTYIREDTQPHNVYVDLGTEDFSEDEPSIKDMLNEARQWQYDRVGKKRDYSKALDLLDKAVKEDKEGSSDAVWELGLMCLREQGFVEINNGEGMAYDLFKKSANGGNGIGFYWMAYCLERGYGDEGKNVKKAQQLYETAYIKLKEERGTGDPYASQYLGFMEYYGKHHKIFSDQSPQFSKARPWLEAAAEAGLPESQVLLGEAYDKQIGETVIQGLHEDPVEAEKWYMRAAAQGHEEAQLKLAQLNERLSRNANATEFSKNIRKRDAIKWYQECARQGNETARARLTEMGESW